MNPNWPITTSPILSKGVDEDRLFPDLVPLEAVSLKQLELSTQLVALMVHCGETRTELAEKLGWKKSRLSHVFSGRGNPTVRTIFEVASRLGHDFDVVFRTPSHSRPLQPWESTFASEVTAERPNHKYRVVVQTAEQVARDLLDGNSKPLYVTLDQNHDFTSEDSCSAVDYTQELAALTKSKPEPFSVIGNKLTYIDV